MSDKTLEALRKFAKDWTDGPVTRLTRILIAHFEEREGAAFPISNEMIREAATREALAWAAEQVRGAEQSDENLRDLAARIERGPGR